MKGLIKKMIVIGIDIGGSITKIIGIKDGVQMQPLQVKATDPVTSLYGALGRYMSENGLGLSDISKIKITGVGSSYIKQDMYGIPTEKVTEFKAIGKGGLKLAKLDKAIVISMGTGTAFVKAHKENGVVATEHLGGSGVGGGTLLGLSSKLLDTYNFESICSLASSGELTNVDLTVGDISKTSTSTLPLHTTASNFGKISDYATKGDIAIGLINMVFQTIGMMAVFACRAENTKDVILCGNLTTIPHTAELFKAISDLHGINFHLPEHAEYATALGAALH